MADSSNPVVQRLKLIKNMIQLGETSTLDDQAERLRDTDGTEIVDKSVREIADCLDEQRYSDAISQIDSCLQRKAAIQKHEDPRLSALRLEAEALEERLSELESEKAEIEREIHEFNLRHEQELGPILEEILEVRAERKRRQAEQNTGSQEAQTEYKEARAEYEEYSQAVEEAQEEERIELDEEQKGELKQLYREASKQCHPDAVEEGREKEARELFVDLQDAYERNDLDEVRRISQQVKEGTAFGSRTDEIDEIKKLESEVERLRQRVDELKREIEVLRASDAYQTVSEVDDLDAYFEDRKMRLQDELEHLRNQPPTA